MRNTKIGLLVRESLDPPAKDAMRADALDGSMDGYEGDTVVKRVEELGYLPPSVKSIRAAAAARAEERERQIRRATKPLATALRSGGVKPFTDESVTVYKAAMLRRRFQLTDKPIHENNVAMGSIVGVGFVLNILLCLLVGGLMSFVAFGLIPVLAFMGLILFCSLTKEPPTRKAPVLLFSGLMLLACGSTIWTVFVFGPKDLEWQLVELRNYDRDIPHEVLATVAEINFHCPEAIFYVDQLVKKPDPFLVVKLADETYYVEVWAEPNFRGKRLA